MAETLSPSPWADRQDSICQNPPISYAALQARLSKIDRIIADTAQRYSRGSVTRVALDNLALEIRERS